MENQTENPDLFALQIDSASQSYLYESAKWGKFISIIGFIACGIIVLVGIFFAFLASSIMESAIPGFGAAAGSGAIILIVCLLGAGLAFFPNYFLYNYSKKLKDALGTTDQEGISLAFNNLKSFFKFQGILLIIVLSFYVLMIIVSLLTALSHR
jgi:hypothetical protein